MIIDPMPMPNRAVATGRPMASTDPKARIRMTMAKAMPRSSVDGSLNSAKIVPPSSTCRPSMTGASSWISLLISVARVNSMSSGSSTLANAIWPAASPCEAICCSPPSS